MLGLDHQTEIARSPCGCLANRWQARCARHNRPRATCVRGRPWIMRDALTSDGLSQWGFVYLAALVKPTTRAVSKPRPSRDDLPVFQATGKGRLTSKFASRYGAVTQKDCLSVRAQAVMEFRQGPSSISGGDGSVTMYLLMMLKSN
jgi:hypothetical protein